jgi:hypothetical protein
VGRSLTLHSSSDLEMLLEKVYKAAEGEYFTFKRENKALEALKEEIVVVDHVGREAQRLKGRRRRS